MKIWSILWWVFLALVLLVYAIVQAVQGDWLPAIFFAVLWAGLTNNTNATIIVWAINRDKS